MRSSVLSRLLPRQRLLCGWLYHYPRLLCAALSTTPLACARWLRAPAAVAQRRGDLEHADWWERHRNTLEAAWRQYGRSDERVYRLPTLGRGLHPACPLLGAGSLASLEQPAPGVYAFPLFTPAFCEALLDEVCRCTRAQTFGPFFCLAVATPIRTQAPRALVAPVRPPRGSRHPDAPAQRHEPVWDDPLGTGLWRAAARAERAVGRAARRAALSRVGGGPQQQVDSTPLE